MLSPLRVLTLCALLVIGVKESYGSTIHQHYPYQNVSISTTYYTTTSSCTTTTEIPSITISSTSTITCENSTTTTIIPPTTITTPTTITSLTTVTPPTPITPSTFSTSVFNPCPTTCSIYAGTVDLFYWPTDNDYLYPSTYVDTRLDYTFTSPSVYMVINTIYGYNSQGRAGPAASSPIFALDLDQVSSIDGDVTRQVSLSDLGTDCPHSLDPSVIATMAPDGRCDPSLAAPDAVKSWALPCNACGRFGLFDPPYAVPTLGGGLIETTSTITATEPGTTILVPTTTTPAATGASSTAVEATTTTVPLATSTDTEAPTSTDVQTPTSTSVEATITTDVPVTTESSIVATSDSTAIPSSASLDPTGVVTASATKITGGLACLVLTIFVSIHLM